MSYDLFWYGNAEDYWAYRFAYMKRLEFEQEVTNQNAWLQGLYFFDALSKALSNSNRSKSSDPTYYYMDKPIDFKQQKIDSNKEEEKLILDNKMKVYLQNYKSKLDRKNKKKVGNELGRK